MEIVIEKQRFQFPKEATVQQALEFLLEYYRKKETANADNQKD